MAAVFEDVPRALLRVLPQLEDELKVEEVAVRLVAVRTLGRMFAAPTAVLLAESPKLWRQWLDR